jgi:hypothetical protein
MKKLFYNTKGNEPDIECIDPCEFEKYRPNKGTMIGSASCQKCRACHGWDSEECWVKCLAYALETNINNKNN